MNPSDLTLLWLLTALALAAAILRILLARKKGQPQRLFWAIQELIFPGLLLLSLVLWQAAGTDLVFPAVMLGLLEEIVCIFLRRRQSK